MTSGPGLAYCLQVGIEKAKEIAISHNIPLIAVNHMEVCPHHHHRHQPFHHCRHRHQRHLRHYHTASSALFHY